MLYEIAISCIGNVVSAKKVMLLARKLKHLALKTFHSHTFETFVYSLSVSFVVILKEGKKGLHR